MMNIPNIFEGTSKNARPKRSEGEEKTRQNDINVIWRPDVLGVGVISKVSRDPGSPY